MNKFKNLRVNKILRNYGICLVSKKYHMIRDKKILNNEIIEEIGMKLNLDSNISHVNCEENKSFNIIQELVFLNKPKNVITIYSDDHKRKINIEFLPQRYKKGNWKLFNINKIKTV